jgi:hypothetical protein
LTFELQIGRLCIEHVAMQQQFSKTFLPLPARIVGSVFGLAFCGIGLTVLGFLWLTPFDAFGSPPLVFRFFGSFIAIMFVVTGGTLAYNMLTGKLEAMGAPAIPAASQQPSMTDPSSNTYTCPHCGAPVGSRIDVSPLGDVKCPFCHAWFNIHNARVS